MAETHGDYIKYCVKENKIEPYCISTINNLADIMTKPLQLDAHKRLRNRILKIVD